MNLLRAVHFFHQHCTHEVFSQFFHPLLIRLAQCSRCHGKQAKQIWKSVNGIERDDLRSFWFAARPIEGSLHYLIAKQGKIELCDQSLFHAVVYAWHKTAKWMLKKKKYRPSDRIVLQCCQVLLARGVVTNLEHLSGYLRTQDKDVRSTLCIDFARLCYEGHLDAAVWLHNTFDLTSLDVKERNNLALKVSIRRDQSYVVCWLVDTFDYSLAEIEQALQNCEPKIRQKYARLLL